MTYPVQHRIGACGGLLAEVGPVTQPLCHLAGTALPSRHWPLASSGTEAGEKVDETADLGVNVQCLETRVLVIADGNGEYIQPGRLPIRWISGDRGISRGRQYRCIWPGERLASRSTAVMLHPTLRLDKRRAPGSYAVVFLRDLVDAPGTPQYRPILRELAYLRSLSTA